MEPSRPSASNEDGTGLAAIKANCDTLAPPRRTGLSRQSDNVPFEQSRNVPLTTPSLVDARRTLRDEAEGQGPVGGTAEGEEEADHTKGGGKGVGVECAPGEAIGPVVEEAWREGGDSRAPGKPSNQRIEKSVEQEAVQILSADLYKGFGPTLASEYLADQHDIEVSKETVRQWMIRSKLWHAKELKEKVRHERRPRRSRCGQLVQWDTSEHDWLEGRGEKLYLIAMIDDATSRLFARFVRHDTSEENMKLLWSYVEKFGRPLAFYTDKASIFQTAEKHKRDEPGVEKDPVEMPPTQIGRALLELGVVWIAAHSPQAKAYASHCTSSVRAATTCVAGNRLEYRTP